jgi:hypothetical protein
MATTNGGKLEATRGAKKKDLEKKQEYIKKLPEQQLKFSYLKLHIQGTWIETLVRGIPHRQADKTSDRRTSI